MALTEGITEVSANRFDKMELAGAFGDLGTLIPFILIYISMLKLDPAGVLFSFGIANILTGWYYKTPIPVQPMKAIGAMAATRAAIITPGQVWGAGLFTGVLWLVLGLTGGIEYIGKLVARPVIKGILLGLGFTFIFQSFKMMYTSPFIALTGLILLLVFRQNRRVPVILIILFLGIVLTIVREPGSIGKLMSIRPDLALPAFHLAPFSSKEFISGALTLGLIQVPLTIGSGILAITAENNELFPQRQVTNRRIALSTGLMNIFSAFSGGVPICHGAGGMAGHIRFGARTGGATIILGFLLLLLALFFGDSIEFLLRLFPLPILGTILFWAGFQLASSSLAGQQTRNDYIVWIITGLVSVWNLAIGMLIGVVLYFTLEGSFKLENKKPGSHSTRP